MEEKHSKSILDQDSSIWENKQAELLSSLDQKVSTLLELKNIMESCSLDDPHELVAGQLFQFIYSAKDLYPVAFQNFHTIQELRKKANELDDEMDFLDDEDIEEEKAGESLELFEEVSKLESNEDVMFVQGIQDTVHNLIAKNKSVHAINRKGIENIVPFSSEEIENVQITPFSVNIILKQELFNRQYGNIKGFHVDNSPLNVIRGGFRLPSETTIQDTVQHEEVHNILDATLGKSRKQASPVRSLIHILKRYEQIPQDAPGFIKKHYERIIDSITISDLINSAREELLSHVAIAENGSFKSSNSLVRLGQEIFKDSSDRPEEFTSTVLSMATYGKAMIELDLYLKDVGENKDIDEAVRNKFITLRRQLHSQFENVFNNLKTNLGIAERLGSEAHMEAHALLYILPVSKYRHIKSYLIYKYGEAQVEQAEKSYKLVSLFAPPFNGIDQINTSLVTEDILGEIDRQILIKKLVSERDKIVDQVLSTPEKADEFIEQLKELSANLGVPEIGIELSHELRGTLAFNYIYIGESEGYHRMQEFVDHIPLQDLNGFAENVAGFIMFEYWDDTEGDITMDHIMTTSLWIKLQECGLDTYVEPLLIKLIKEVNDQ